ncbi:FAD-dependent oxidoreductase [bacterium]|nr:FAD-dependent oxidoreductase [bacterium]
MADVDVTVIGGGIVGCAVAARAAGDGLATVLLERGPQLAGGTTSRNSEVVHGGMYYPTDSLKAQLCVEGRRKLRTFCEVNGIRYRECGKLIVAVEPDELPVLEEIHAQGEINGVEGLRLIDATEVSSLEPEVRAVGALWSPHTAVMDAEACAKAYGRKAQTASAQVLCGAEVVGLSLEADSWRVEVAPPVGGGREGWQHTSRWVVNAAGLYADRVAELAGIDVDARQWRLRWVKGNYFAISPRHDGRVGRLVYPVPPRDGSSLGTHLCLDVAGRLRLGPDVEVLPPRAGEDYRVDEERADDFYRGARRFLPFLEREDLTPDMSGLRPRRVAWWTEGFADFVVARESSDRQGLINLVGIESPGLTAAPAIADRVGDWLSG